MLDATRRSCRPSVCTRHFICDGLQPLWKHKQSARSTTAATTCLCLRRPLWFSYSRRLYDSYPPQSSLDLAYSFLAQPIGGLFGTPAASSTAAPAATGGGLFGNFGNTSNGPTTLSTPAAAPATGSLFGNTNAGTTPAPTGALFGGTSAASGTTTTSAAPAGGNSFSGFGQAKPADQNAPKPASTGRMCSFIH
jgi:hypothetical protein